MKDVEPVRGSHEATDLSTEANVDAPASVPNSRANRGVLNKGAAGILRWCRDLIGDLRHSTPHEQLAILYYGFGVLAVFGAIFGFAYKHLWVEEAQAANYGPLYSC